MIETRFHHVFLAGLIPFLALLFAPLKAATPSDLYPLILGSEWDYTETYAEEGAVVRETIRCEGPCQDGGKEGWITLRGQQQGLFYEIRPDAQGIWMRRTRRRIPLLGRIRVTFDPPILFLKYPLVKGERWIYEGEAQTWIKDQRVKIEFVSVGWVRAEWAGMSGHAWRVDCRAIHSRGGTMDQTSLYVTSTGYVGGWTPDSQTRLDRYDRRGILRGSSHPSSDPNAAEPASGQTPKVQEGLESGSGP